MTLSHSSSLPSSLPVTDIDGDEVAVEIGDYIVAGREDSLDFGEVERILPGKVMVRWEIGGALIGATRPSLERDGGCRVYTSRLCAVAAYRARGGRAECTYGGGLL